jgi:Arc/MetJ-type ribon-helix-helix transcriptional regulator
MEHPKTKVSITLAPDLVRAVDRAVKRGRGESRSSVIDAWLRRAARINAEDTLRAETVAYYETLSAQESSENTAIARASSRAARKLELDRG